MKLILDIKENRASFFMELIQSLDYIRVLKEVKGADMEEAIQDLTDAFDDVKKHEAGELKLKSALDLLDEL